MRELLRDFGDVRYVWRHLPLNDVHPHAQLAAEASEAAASQGAFWEMHDLLLDHQDALEPNDLIGYARAARARRRAVHGGHRCASTARPRVADDVDSADLSGVSGTPTFFINGRRHYGAYDIDTLCRPPFARRGARAVARTALGACAYRCASARKPERSCWLQWISETTDVRRSATWMQHARR